MNFIERLEEGLGEDSSRSNATHMRTSTFQKASQEINSQESFLTEEDSDMARSTVVSGDASA